MQGNGLARPHQHFTAPKWDTIKISAIQSLRGWLSRWIHSALGLALSVIRVPGIYIIKPHEISHPCVVALKAAPSLFPMLPAFRLDAFSSFLPLVYPGYTNSLYSPLLPFKLERGPSRFEMSSVYGILSHALFFISRLFSLLLIISPSASLSLVNEIIPWPFWQWIIPNCAYYEDERESFIIPYSATTHRLWHPRCKSLEPFSIIYHTSLSLSPPVIRFSVSIPLSPSPVLAKLRDTIRDFMSITSCSTTRLCIITFSIRVSHLFEPYKLSYFHYSHDGGTHIYFIFLNLPLHDCIIKFHCILCGPWLWIFIPITYVCDTEN